MARLGIVTGQSVWDIIQRTCCHQIVGVSVVESNNQALRVDVMTLIIKMKFPCVSEFASTLRTKNLTKILCIYNLLALQRFY